MWRELKKCLWKSKDILGDIHPVWSFHWHVKWITANELKQGHAWELRWKTSTLKHKFRLNLHDLQTKGFTFLVHGTWMFTKHLGQCGPPGHTYTFSQSKPLSKHLVFLCSPQQMLETSLFCPVTQLSVQDFVCQGQSSGIFNIRLLFSMMFSCSVRTQVFIALSIPVPE